MYSTENLLGSSINSAVVSSAKRLNSSSDVSDNMSIAWQETRTDKQKMGKTENPKRRETAGDLSTKGFIS